MDADLILTNGRVYTVDGKRSEARAIAITGGHIAAVGGYFDMAPHRGATTRIVDLGGKMVLPGIVDVHNHHTRGGQADLFEINISPVMDLDQILAAVRAYAAKIPAGEWIVGGIWGSNLIARLEQMSARAALDEASPDHPVMLRDDSQHNRWVNGRALALIGIARDTPDPPEGSIVRDPASGEAVGLLLEKASAIAERAVRRTIPDAAGRDLASTRRAIEILNSYGITAFQDANTMLPFLTALKTLDSAGQLTARCVASLPALDSTYGPDVYGDAILAVRENYRGRHVYPDYIKLFMDGVPTTRTAAMLEPYIATALTGCCYRGDALISIPELVRWIAKAESLGLAVKIHCTGDAAVRDALDAIDVVRSFNGPITEIQTAPHQIAHASFIDPADIPRFKELGVAADLSPIIWYPGPIVEAIMAVVPEARAREYWPNRALHEAGALLAAGSDWPVMPQPDPWLGIEGMITRRNPNGRTPGALWPEQALDLATVLEIYTINAARAMGLGHLTGSIEVGKSADLIVIDRDLFTIPVEDIGDTKVLTTYFEGNIVFERAA
jgi:predicted amidohydrolase YtcJ